MMIDPETEAAERLLAASPGIREVDRREVQTQIDMDELDMAVIWNLSALADMGLRIPADVADVVRAEYAAPGLPHPTEVERLLALVS